MIEGVTDQAVAAGLGPRTRAGVGDGEADIESLSRRNRLWRVQRDQGGLVRRNGRLYGGRRALRRGRLHRPGRRGGGGRGDGARADGGPAGGRAPGPRGGGGGGGGPPPPAPRP